MQIVFSKGRAAVAYVEQKLYSVYLIAYFLDTSDKLVTEYERVRIGKLEAVFYLVRGISVVKRNSECTRLEYTEVYGKPFKAVHQKYSDLITLLNAAAQEQICAPVSLFFKNAPGNLTAEGFSVA